MGLKRMLALRKRSRSVLEVINWYLFFGLFSYGVGFILMFLAFKEGELSVLYPILSTSYVWVVLLSPFIFVGESIGALKLIGVTIIIFSVSLIGIGASKNRGGIVG